eukprot:TRINITY_DN99_c1_g1_i6.p3 TRINITY_DN99_c1_g1~~TRINITY_DN99_c1_g1_i6.p3  ORF type:complete len:104 (+),score=9.79 TRINITY_DN99_c1_g1_i6:506-817(+)
MKPYLAPAAWKNGCRTWKCRRWIWGGGGDYPSSESPSRNCSTPTLMVQSVATGVRLVVAQFPGCLKTHRDALRELQRTLSSMKATQGESDRGKEGISVKHLSR